VSQWGHDFRARVPRPGGAARALRRRAARCADGHRRRPHARRHRRAAAAQKTRTFISSFDRPNIRYSSSRRRTPRPSCSASSTTSTPVPTATTPASSTASRARESRGLATMLNEAKANALPYHAGLDAAVRQRHQDRFLREDGLVMWPRSPSAWASTSPTCASSRTSTCPRTSRATTRRPAARAATASRRRPGWPTACRTW
jgi:ATP-dependent DNA helicase RecQ